MLIGLHIHKLNKTLLFFVSIIFPGLAHFLLNQRLKATVISGSFIYHLLLIGVIYNDQLLQKPLSIVTLLLAICVHYFYSVFDTLQLFEYKEKPLQPSLKIVLAFSIVMVWGLGVIVSWFVPIVAETVVYIYPSTFLTFIILYLATHLKSKQWNAVYVGRWTAIVALSFFAITAIGHTSLWQQLQVKILLITFVVMLAFEFSSLYLIKRINRNKRIKLKFDIVACVVIVVFSVVFLLVPKYGHLPSELLKSFHNIDREEYNYDIKQISRREIQPISIAVTDAHLALNINHKNGLVKLQSYQGEYIKIEPVRYDVADAKFQSEIEKVNRVEVSIDEQKMNIETMLAQYEGLVSKMDIIISIPYSVRLDELTISIDYGTVQIERINQFKRINVSGDHVNVNSLHSSGDIVVKLIEGNSYIYKHYGYVTVNTRTGHIMLYDILREIQAETLNGNIIISTKVLNESITAHASVGGVQLNLPEIVQYNLIAESSFGYIVVNDIKYEYNISNTSFITKKLIHIYADQNIVID